MRTYPVPNEHGMTPHYAVKVRLAKGGTLLTGVLPRKARHGGMTRNSASFRVFTRNSLGRFFQMSIALSAKGQERTGRICCRDD